MQPHSLNDKQVNFLKKLYFLFGQTNIPFLGDVDLGEEWSDLFPDNKFITDILSVEYLSESRRFTDKFVEDFING